MHVLLHQHSGGVDLLLLKWNIQSRCEYPWKVFQHVQNEIKLKFRIVRFLRRIALLYRLKK